MNRNIFLVIISALTALIMCLGSVEPQPQLSASPSVSPGATASASQSATGTVAPSTTASLSVTASTLVTVKPTVIPTVTAPSQPTVISMAFAVTDPPEDVLIPKHYTNVFVKDQHVYAFSNASGEVEYRAYGELTAIWSDGTTAVSSGYFSVDEQLNVLLSEPVDTDKEGYGRAVLVALDDAQKTVEGYVQSSASVFYFKTAGGITFYRAYAKIGSKCGFYPCDKNGSVRDGALAADANEDKLLMQSVGLPVSAVNAPYTVLQEVKVNTLINMNHRLPAEYVPQDLISVKEHLYRAPFTLRDDPTYANCYALEAFLSMVNAAYDEQGIDTFLLCNVYRTYAKQQKNWDSRVNADPTYGTNPLKPIGAAYPGTSEHQSGLAFDITCLSHKTPGPGFADTAEARWLKENSWRFGFILRYQKDKELLTGIKFEPYHFRYVGVALAEHLYKEGLCLEEYYDAPVMWFETAQPPQNELPEETASPQASQPSTSAPSATLPGTSAPSITKKPTATVKATA